MKILKSMPQGDGTKFFERYADLTHSLTKVSIFAQLVTGFAEIGILYTLLYPSVKDLFPSQAATIATCGGTIQRKKRTKHRQKCVSLALKNRTIRRTMQPKNGTIRGYITIFVLRLIHLILVSVRTAEMTFIETIKYKDFAAKIAGKTHGKIRRDETLI
jgi:hypothetical protein